MNGNHSNEKEYRRFQIPGSYSVELLARDLADWLKKEHGRETEILNVSDGCVVQARDTGGRLSRLVKRKAGAMHVVLFPECGCLKTLAANDEWVEPVCGNGEKKWSFKAAASMAVDATAGLAEAAASGVSDVWLESGTADAVYEFISRHIATGHCKAKNLAPIAVDHLLSRYVEPMTDVESAWIAGFLEPQDTLIAWLRTSTHANKKAEWTFAMTTRKVALAAFSRNGLEDEKLLPNEKMAVTDTVGRDDVTIGDVVFRTQLQNDFLFREIADIMELDPVRRLSEAARLNFFHSDEAEKHLEYAKSILDHVTKVSDLPLPALSRFYIDMDHEKMKKEVDPFMEPATDSKFRSVAEKLGSAASPEGLKMWAELWRLDPLEKLSLAGRLQNLFPESQPHAQLAAPLFEGGREELLRANRDKSLHLLADVRVADNMIKTGRLAEAVTILENRLTQLPDESLSDLLPPRDSDLTRGEGGQVIRIRILELLVEARGEPGEPDAKTLRELAVLQPLVPERLQKLTGARGHGGRASLMLRILEKDGLASGPDDGKPVPSGKAAPLSSDAIQEKLRHPASREGTVLGKVQNFIAVKNTPDHTSLKSYAKRVNMNNFPEVLASIVDGTFILGLKSVEAYISYGDLNTGVRSYEGKPPFLLVGGEHLEDGSDLHMTPSELRFAIGEELAHLRYGHERITSREVWEGAFDKAMSLIELFPVVGGYLSKLGAFGKFAGQASGIVKTIGDAQQYISQTRTVVSSAKDAYDRHLGDETQDDFKPEEKNLIGAFREMQLTADRAALVLSGDLKAAVRAIFKADQDLQVELPMAEKYGIKRFLGRTDDQGGLMHQDLAIRLAALFSFYISEDYETLRADAMPGCE